MSKSNILLVIIAAFVSGAFTTAGFIEYVLAKFLQSGITSIELTGKVDAVNALLVIGGGIILFIGALFFAGLLSKGPGQ